MLNIGGSDIALRRRGGLVRVQGLVAEVEHKALVGIAGALLELVHQLVLLQGRRPKRESVWYHLLYGTFFVRVN